VGSVCPDLDLTTEFKMVLCYVVCLSSVALP